MKWPLPCRRLKRKRNSPGQIMPRFVVAGLASVTTLSIIVAGIFASIL